mmetsp:Transcript_31832/g.39565  ORF Transcript_31832/g.39565 Transcript_31832/m.39565 type:complete len:104 (+) Transcript_31832:4111-4422(+)
MQGKVVRAQANHVRVVLLKKLRFDIHVGLIERSDPFQASFCVMKAPWTLDPATEIIESELTEFFIDAFFFELLEHVVFFAAWTQEDLALRQHLYDLVLICEEL